MILTLLCMAFAGIGLYIVVLAVAALRSGSGFVSYGSLFALGGVLWCAAIFFQRKLNQLKSNLRSQRQ
jgi:hypothetical protein